MESIDATTVVIVFGVAAIGIVIGYLVGRWVTEGRKEEEFTVRTPIEREDAARRSRSSLGGQVLEKIAPHLPDFPYDPTELRFIGSPIDFVVFRGLNSDDVEEVIFLEMKSGKSRLTSRERSVQRTIEAKNVRWDVYTVPITP
jgi:predicted Holliday junction resolvase-like endonuclease